MWMWASVGYTDFNYCFYIGEVMNRRDFLKNTAIASLALLPGRGWQTPDEKYFDEAVSEQPVNELITTESTDDGDLYEIVIRKGNTSVTVSMLELNNFNLTKNFSGKTEITLQFDNKKAMQALNLMCMRDIMTITNESDDA